MPGLLVGIAGTPAPPCLRTNSCPPPVPLDLGWLLPFLVIAGVVLFGLMWLTFKPRGAARPDGDVAAPGPSMDPWAVPDRPDSEGDGA